MESSSSLLVFPGHQFKKNTLNVIMMEEITDCMFADW